MTKPMPDWEEKLRKQWNESVPHQTIDVNRVDFGRLLETLDELRGVMKKLYESGGPQPVAEGVQGGECCVFCCGDNGTHNAGCPWPEVVALVRNP